MKLLCARDKRSGFIFANSCEKRGGSDLHAVASLALWINRLGYKRLVLRCDP